MILRHATTKARLQQIKADGFFRVSKADPQSRIKGVWLHSKSQSAWAVVHTIRKHSADLADVVVVELSVSRTQLRRFRTGLWVSGIDIPASAIRSIYSGAQFGASASE